MEKCRSDGLPASPFALEQGGCRPLGTERPIGEREACSELKAASSFGGIEFASPHGTFIGRSVSPAPLLKQCAGNAMSASPAAPANSVLVCLTVDPPVAASSLSLSSPSCSSASPSSSSYHIGTLPSPLEFHGSAVGPTPLDSTQSTHSDLCCFIKLPTMSDGLQDRLRNAAPGGA